MAEGEQNFPVKYETRNNPELEVLATNLERSLLSRTKAPYINSSGGWVQEKIKHTGDIAKTVATIATSGPGDSTEAGAVITHLTKKGLHPVRGYGKVLFVDCSSSLQGVQADKPLENLRDQVGKSTLMQITEAIKQNGIELAGYGNLGEYLRHYHEMNQDWGLGYDYSELLLRLIQSLGAGKRGFLSSSKDPIHLIPVFNLGSDFLPLANSVEFGENDHFEKVSDDLASEVARFYKLAKIITKLESTDGFVCDSYGPYGRTLIVPELALDIVGRVAEWDDYPNVTDEVKKLGASKIEYVDRIRSQNAYMYKDMVSGKMDSPPPGHASFRQPRGIRGI